MKICLHIFLMNLHMDVRWVEKKKLSSKNKEW